MICPICGSETIRLLKNKRRTFYRCASCFFAWADPASWPGEDVSRKRYDLHHNEGSEYSDYLAKIIDRALFFAGHAERILDWGSGPKPLASQILRERGFEVFSYDPLFSAQMPPSSYFDLGLSIESAEHFKTPIDDFRTFTGAFKIGALALIHTHIAPADDKAFLEWWYTEDITHVSFYSEECFYVIGKKLSLEIVAIEERMRIVLRKQ